MEITAQMVTAAYNAMRARGLQASADGAREVVAAVLATLPTRDRMDREVAATEAMEWAAGLMAGDAIENTTLIERTDCLLRLARFRLGEDL